MELLQLQYFLALAETEHVTNTASALNISQPALTITIKKLESELGVPLFEHSGRNIFLSKYGKVYKEYVEQSLINLKNGQTMLNQLKDNEEKNIRLGVLSPYIWSEMFSSFRELHQDIILSRYSMEGQQYIRALLDGKIDMYIGGINNLNNSKLNYEILYEDKMVLLVNKQHHLAKYNNIDLRTCNNEKFINLARDTNLQDFISSIYKESNFSPYIVMEADYTLRDELVSLNYGITVTTEQSALKCSFDNVKAIAITYPTLKRRLGVVWRNGIVFTETMQQFLNFILDYYS